tara:strand:- start:3056 stop:4894 length:1839 start_codon:yes stop_codon:yes gene_type:complete
MPSTFTENTGIEKIADGEQSALWGDTTNLNLDIVDRALNGSVNITLSGTTHTLTTSDGVLSDGQFSVLVFTGSPSGTNTVSIAPDTAQKTYFVTNSTAQTVVFSQGSGANVSVAPGLSKIVFTNGAGVGAAVFDITNTLSMGAVAISGGSINGATVGAASAATGAFTTLASSGVTTLNGTTIPASATLVSTAATQTLTNKTLTAPVLNTADINTPDIDGGTIDGTTIGAATPAAGSFTTLASSGVTTLNGTTIPASVTLVSTAATQTLTNKTLTTPDINGGTIDGTTIGAATPAAGSFTTVAGNGAALTALNATQLTTGTIPNARVSGLPTANVEGLDTALAGKLATGANAVSATKLVTARTLALSGDVTGSVSFDGTANATITAVVVDDSHNHVTANVDGLDTALAGKLATGDNAVSATKLATARTIDLIGDVTTTAVAFDGTANIAISVVVNDDSHNHVTENVDGLDTALASKASTDTGVTAGNGLSGGGTLAASRTITLGTPGTCSTGTGNSVSASSHTHTVSLSAADVGDRTAQFVYGAVGNFAMLSYTNATVTYAPGFSLAGSSLRYASASGATVISPAPGGTWELQGMANAGQASDSAVSLWLRVI